VIGREFSWELLAPVAQRREAELQKALSRLGEAGLVFSRGTPPHAAYLFKHALVRDAAYGSLLRRRREELHARIAAVLEVDFADRIAAEPELLARHLTDAGLLEKAVSWWQRAGERATERSANREAIAHFRKALDILGTLPGSPQRDHTELNLQMALGSALTTTGFGAPEKEQAYARARQLADRLGEGAGVFPALWHLGEVHASRGEPLPAYDIGRQCLRIAESAGDPRLLLGAHHLIGESAFWLGLLLDGSRHLEQALALYDPERDRDLVTYYGIDPFGLSCGVAAWARQILGAGKRALGLCDGGLTRARGLSHTFSVVFTLMTGAGVCVMQRDTDRIRSGLAELLPLCAEHGYHEMMGWAEWMSGWAAFYTTGSADAIAQSKAALRHFDHAGGVPGMPWLKGMLAEMYACAGMLEEARSALAEALEVSRFSQQHFYDAELYRIAGQIALAAGGSCLAAAEQSFRTAIADARDRKAKCWELRAATSLARLLARQDRSKEASDLLAPVYTWFTEGFDTADLKEAKALLDALA
jgi:predicted ATPase